MRRATALHSRLLLIHPLASIKQAGAKPQASIDIACSRLKAAGLRITQPRVAILEALIKRAQPASIEQIHNDLANSACDLVTVYRCLAAFQEVDQNLFALGVAQWPQVSGAEVFAQLTVHGRAITGRSRAPFIPDAVRTPSA